MGLSEEQRRRNQLTLYSPFLQWLNLETDINGKLFKKCQSDDFTFFKMQLSVSSLSKYYRDLVIDDISSFEICKTIGNGNFSIAYLFKEKDSGKLFCGKQIFLDEKDKTREEQFCREVRILKYYHNDFLPNLIGFTIQEPFYVITDYISNGTLWDYITSVEKRKPEISTKIALEIAKGMEQLHNNSIFHLDLKPSNILLDDQFKPYIIDFGTSKLPEEEQSELTQFGSPQYIAPERLSIHHFTNKVDVYSYGIILLEMATGHSAFPNYTSAQILGELGKKLRPEIPSSIGFSLEFLIRTCIDYEPKERPSFSQIVSMFESKTVHFV